jgi:hypothetical protein
MFFFVSITRVKSQISNLNQEPDHFWARCMCLLLPDSQFGSQTAQPLEFIYLLFLIKYY